MMKNTEFTRKKFIATMTLGALSYIYSTYSYGSPLKLAGQNKDKRHDLLFYKDSSGQIKPVETFSDWQMKRGQILEGMQKAMGELPDKRNLPPLDIKIIESQQESTYVRHTIHFIVAEDERLPCYLYIPIQEGKPKRLAAMMVLHGTGALGKQLVDGKSPLPNRAQAKELAERGYVVIAPDFPSYGDLKDYDFEHDRYQSGSMKGVFNHMRCVDLLQSRNDVDPNRIGVLGHSLGGYNAMFVGAFDIRLKVVVSSSGWTLFEDYQPSEGMKPHYSSRLAPWAKDVHMPLLEKKYNLDDTSFPFDFDEVVASIAPRAFFSNSPLHDFFKVEGVRKGIASATKVYRFLGADGYLQVRYPNSGHDFPLDVRKDAYKFIDKVLEHIPNAQTLEGV